MNTLELTKPKAQKRSGAAAKAIADLDPQLSRFANAALELMRLQALQTVAAHKDPANYPLKPGQVRLQNSANPNKLYDNVGLAVDKWLKAMPADKRAKLLADFELEAHLTPELRAAIQQARIDLKSPKPMLEQVDLKSRYSFVDADLIKKAAASRKFDEVTIRSDGAAPSASRAAVNTGVKFRVNKVKCIDETTDAEWKGTDDIELGGAAVDDKNKTTEIPKFFVGEFNDGDEKAYDPPKLVKTFTLSGSYPKLFVVFISIAERDSGGFATFISDLVGAVQDEVVAIVEAGAVAAGTAIGGVVGGPVGALIGAVGGFLIASIVELIGHIASDEVWEPQMSSMYMESATDTFAEGKLESTSRKWTYEDYSGKYNVHYSWEIDR